MRYGRKVMLRYNVIAKLCNAKRYIQEQKEEQEEDKYSRRQCQARKKWVD